MDLTIKDLCKACFEYDRNTTVIKTLESSIKHDKTIGHYEWSVKKETKQLNTLLKRQAEIKELILNINKVVF